jgi:hypothetical protein
MPLRQTILVFDTGLGGLTVLREIMPTRPDARYIYVADGLDQSGVGDCTARRGFARTAERRRR